MKERILQELKNHAGHYISGEEISGSLQVSRTAVWKYVNQLKNMGYVIESQTKKGYRLLESPDSLQPQEMKGNINTEVIGQNLTFFEQVDSTNLYAKQIAEGGFLDGTVIMADEQLNGRGRMGRSWVSPKGKGIWMTIMLKPKINPADASKVTLLAACAICRAIEEICGLYTKIKWPNDIVLNGKKLCGILTEMSAEIDEINYLIIGIGVNVNIDLDDFPKELQDIATSIKIEKGDKVIRKELAAAIINNFERYYKGFIKTGSIKDYINEYKEKSAVLGKEVIVKSSILELQGTVVDISEEGQLQLELKDGSIKEIISGEVSLRGLTGYTS
ncbi:MAG: biotin--[acetyl-CoA-carboxylase] ligase [Clostridia bacterium]|jgi:BirA family biotin operon repressor/biotin-[acetyl-CoA-carboxylase] ligase|nr:biotin--[acetyl-CoA-carboxylase] ligase [Clostridia bacterium]